MYILCQDQALASGISKHVAMDSDRGGLHSDLPICNTKPPICQILGGYCARFNTWLENVSFSLQGKQVTQIAKHCSICVLAQRTQAIITGRLLKRNKC
jgi:hypothetical protein